METKIPRSVDHFQVNTTYCPTCDEERETNSEGHCVKCGGKIKELSELRWYFSYLRSLSRR